MKNDICIVPSARGRRIVAVLVVWKGSNSSKGDLTGMEPPSTPCGLRDAAAYASGLSMRKLRTL